MSIKAAVETYLATEDLHCARILRCAKRLNINQSTLNYKLKAEGTTYSRLLDTERRRRCVALRDAGKPLCGKTIARAVGYASVADAHRAVHRWFGVGFCDLRKQEKLYGKIHTPNQ